MFSLICKTVFEIVFYQFRCFTQYKKHISINIDVGPQSFVVGLCLQRLGARLAPKTLRLFRPLGE